MLSWRHFLKSHSLNITLPWYTWKTDLRAMAPRPHVLLMTISYLKQWETCEFWEETNPQEASSKYIVLLTTRIMSWSTRKSISGQTSSVRSNCSFFSLISVNWKTASLISIRHCSHCIGRQISFLRCCLLLDTRSVCVVQNALWRNQHMFQRRIYKYITSILTAMSK